VRFEFVGEEAIVGFESRGYEFPAVDSEMHWPDMDWLVGSFYAEIGPYKGSFEGTILAGELECLVEEIEQALEKPKFEVRFDPVEPHLVFTLESPAVVLKDELRSEDVLVEGRLDYRPILGTELRFAFDTDRQRLGETARDIRNVLARFPTRGRRE
jgi:hypothetical protein